MKKQLHSFLCAFRGIGQAFSGGHMRFHLVACCYVLYFSLFYDFSKAEYSALFLVIALVFAAEAFNSAIEKLCDRVTTQQDPFIRNCKDMAAGAVLLAAAGAVAVGVALFWQPEIFKKIREYFGTDLTRWIPLLASAAVSVLFVSGRLFRREDKHND